MDFVNKKCSEEELQEYISSSSITQKDWGYISYHQDLSEEFIREFKEEVRWYFISWRQKLSKKFKYEMHDKIYIYRTKNKNKIKNPKEVI